MTDFEIIEALIARDNGVTQEFFFQRCRSLFYAIIHKVFDYEVDYDEFVNELYIYLMENDAARLKQFEGKHDFKDFTSKEEDDGDYIRTVYKVETTYIKEIKQFMVSFTGDGFMRYQIRNMVGTALAIAAKKEKEDYIKYHLSDKTNREIVSYKAPSEGLYLVDVNY